MSKTYVGVRQSSAPGDVWVRVLDPESSVPIARLSAPDYHSTGYEWGYHGSGPAELALAILLDHLGEQPRYQCEHRSLAWQLHQAFKRAFVTDWKETWRLSAEQIDGWLSDQVFCDAVQRWLARRLPERLDLLVTYTDCWLGTPLSPRCCPVARAVGRQQPDAHVFAALKHIEVAVPVGRGLLATASYATTRELERWMADYDRLDPSRRYRPIAAELLRTDVALVKREQYRYTLDPPQHVATS
jgi:hypothetical protein